MLEWSWNRNHYQTDDLDLGNTGNINDHFNTHAKILTILIDHWHTDHVDHNSNLDHDYQSLVVDLENEEYPDHANPNHHHYQTAS